MHIQPYLQFDGRAEEAAEYYTRAIGAEVITIIRNKEAPEQPPPGMLPPGSENKVMHMALKVGDSTLLGSDGRCGGHPTFQGITLSLTVKNEAEADRRFAALSEGGQVHMPLTKTFFSPRFGMLADRFGVSWMVYVDPASAGS